MVTNYTYNARGDLTDVVQWGSATYNSSTAVARHFDYDALSRLTQAHNPESGWVCYGSTNLAPANGSNCTPAYDVNGNLGAKADTRGITINYSYDSLNRLTGKTYSVPNPVPFGYAQTPSVAYTYDQGPSSAYPVGRRTGMTEGPMTTSQGWVTSGSSTWKYDLMGRIVSITRSNATPVSPPSSPQSNSATYTYNLAGSPLLGHFFAQGTWYQYSYGADGRATGLTQNGSYPFVSNATYAPGGQLTAMTLGGAPTNSIPITMANSYNNRLQVLTLKATPSGGSPLFNHSLSYPPSTNNGNISTDSDLVDSGNVASYTYDTLNRLKGAQSPGGGLIQPIQPWSETNTFDPFGNLTAKADIYGGVGTSFSTFANPQNQIPSMLQYDPAGTGDVIRDNFNTQYTWDAENRVATAGSVTYYYDGDGNRVLKSNPGSSSTLGSVYWYGPDGSMTDETTVTLNGSNAKDLQRNFYFNGKMVARQGFPTSFYPSNFLISDQLGTTRVAVDFSWNGPGTNPAPELINYFPTGGYLGAPPSDTLDQKFTGKERDAESGLDDFGARYYGSSMGRFMSPDPLMASAHPENPQTWNRYSYALNNPLSIADVDGLYPSPSFNCDKSHKACLSDDQRRILNNSKVNVGDKTLSGEALWNAIGGQKNGEALQNSFVNQTDGLAAVRFADGKSAISFVNSITEIHQDRIFASVGAGLATELAGDNRFETVSASLHSGGGFDALSFKSTNYPQGNIQFSFNGARTGVDIDHDLYMPGIRHLFGEVLVNHMTGGLTNQDSVRQMLIRNPNIGLTPSPDPNWNRK